jgi:uncharacterized protein YkwD
VIRHRAARWLITATCGLTLIGCQQGTDSLSAPETADTVVVTDAPAADIPVNFKHPTPAPTTTAAPQPVPAEMVTPWQPPSTTSTTTTAPPPTEAPRPAPAPRKVGVAAAQAAAPAAEAPPAEPPIDNAGARTLTSLTNGVRTSAGLGALQRDGSLDARAADWAQELASSGRLRHSSIPKSIVGNPWGTAGENVGYGPSVEVVHDALVNSSGHYANITGAAYSRIGVGVAVDAGGQVWVVQVFAG